MELKSSSQYSRFQEIADEHVRDPRQYEGKGFPYWSNCRVEDYNGHSGAVWR